MRSILRGIVALALLGGCSSGHGDPASSPGNPPMDGPPGPTLTAAADAVFVGERTQLTAIFDGDSASIDGIGPVQSGVAVDTPVLSRKTTFTLRVLRGEAHAEAQATVQANYRNRIRVLDAAPIAQANHVATALPDGRAIVMGGN